METYNAHRGKTASLVVVFNLIFVVCHKVAAKLQTTFTAAQSKTYHGLRHKLHFFVYSQESSPASMAFIFILPLSLHLHPVFCSSIHCVKVQSGSLCDSEDLTHPLWSLNTISFQVVDWGAIVFLISPTVTQQMSAGGSWVKRFSPLKKWVILKWEPFFRNLFMSCSLGGIFVSSHICVVLCSDRGKMLCTCSHYD